jgi:2-phospho-L-lactate guanylyltransferase
VTASASGDARRIWAAVPFKGPVGTKRRLMGLLDQDERARVSRAMLADVIHALLGVPEIARVLLLTPVSQTDAAMPPVLQALPDDPRLTLLDEPPEVAGAPGADGLNPALQQAQAVAAAAGASHLLILPADLPLLQSADVTALLAALPPVGETEAESNADHAAGVVIAPDRGTGGTNALLLSPPDLIAPAFGEDSFVRHRALALSVGAVCTVVEREGLALDLDTPADVLALLASGHNGRAASLLRRLGMPARLGQFALAQARSATI